MARTRSRYSFFIFEDSTRRVSPSSLTTDYQKNTVDKDVSQNTKIFGFGRMECTVEIVIVVFHH